MQVTDEIVELGCKAIADQRGYVWPDEFSDDEKKIGRENMRAALTAALSDKQAGEVKIKPLEWVHHDCNYPTWESPLYMFRFQATIDRGEAKRYGEFPLRIDGRMSQVKYATLEAAKNAAQSEFDKRVRGFQRSALVDVPAVEPVGYLKPDFPESVEPRYIPAGERLDGWAKSVFTIPVYTHPPLREGEDSAEVDRLTRPIVGIENRTAQEVFDIMADRFRLAATRSASATTAKDADHG